MLGSSKKKKKKQSVFTAYEQSLHSLFPRQIEIIQFPSSIEDYFFMDLNENDFLTLKNEQSLHVDFLSFPHKLADLL